MNDNTDEKETNQTAVAAAAEPVFAPGEWRFDERVTGEFDEMLARSIPQYAVMREACFDVGSRFVQPQTEIVDLGASRGEAVAPFVDYFGAHNSFTLVESSAPMHDELCRRFKGWLAADEENQFCRLMKIHRLDLRETFPAFPVASLTLCVLTLQFIPINYRQAILERIYEKTCAGGALVVVEKVLGRTAQLDRLFVETYHARKRRNGYSADEVERKRLALEGVLVPQTAAANEQMLADAGFRKVECFWRWLNFAAWVAVK